jgi:hypothetical protein
MASRDKDAREAVISEWDNWVRDNRVMAKAQASVAGLLFYAHLQTEKPKLLNFPCKGDKWRTVRGWLQRAGRLKR